MSENKIAVVHIDSERGWRGGQQQAVYLFEHLLKRNIKTHFICRKNSELASYCKNQKLPFTELPLQNELDLFSAFRIARFCKNNNYNILHLHSAHALSIGLLAKLFKRDLKTIAVRRVDFHIKKNFLSQLKYKNSLLNKLVCISRAIKNVALEDGIDQSKLKVIHSGIKTDKFKDTTSDSNYKEKFGIPQDSILIGTVAALVDHKDYPTLLRAAKIVTEKEKNIYFCAAGSGDMEAELKQLHKDLELGVKFKFLGFRNDIGKFLKSLDIFVLASKMEGLGTSLLDAMAVGLPVIGTRAGGIPEAIKNGKNGLLVQPQNPTALAEKIIELSKDKNLRQRLGENGKTMVQEFSITKTVERNISLYNKLIRYNE